MTKPNHTPTPYYAAQAANTTNEWEIYKSGGDDLTGPDDEAIAEHLTKENAAFVVRACNQYEALGKVAIASGEFLLKHNMENRNALYAALVDLGRPRKSAGGGLA